MVTFLSFTLTLACLFFLDSVKAHGYVADVTIGGKVYPGWDPNVDPYADPVPKRVIRKIPDDGPVLDVHESSLACNVGGNAPAGLVAEAPAGSTVTFTMIRWPDDHLGPVDHYMASCNGNCLTFDATNAEWFKLDAAGLYPNGTWASTELIKNGLSASTVIPAELESGEYLIRHEIIALHSAGQPQFYPACAQVKVTGGGNRQPAAADLVKIPGVYDNVVFPDIWADDFHSFTVPGPTPAFGSNGGTVNAGSPPPPADPSSPAPSHTTSSSPAAGPSKSPVAAPTESVTLSHPSASSTLVSASPSSTGKCRSGHKVRRQLQAHAGRAVRNHARGKRHH
jgi:hypothetical protein